MRISDWSSDVCSSDLRHVIAERRRLTVTPRLRRAQSAVVVAIAHHVRRRAERALIEYAHPVESVIGVARLLRVGPRQLRPVAVPVPRSEEHTSELQSLMRISYAVFCLKTKTDT